MIAQIESQDADWTAQAFRFFKQKFYGPMNSPYQFMAIGEKETVGRFTDAQLQEWYQAKVVSAPRVLAIYGDVDSAQAESLARAALKRTTAVKLASPTQGRGYPDPQVRINPA